MLTSTQPLGSVLSPSHGPSSLSSSTVSPGQWAPRRGVSKVSSTRISVSEYGQAFVGTVDREQNGPITSSDGRGEIALKATVKVHLKEAESSNPAMVANMARPWLFLELLSEEREPRTEKERELHEAKYSHTERTASGQTSFVYEATISRPSFGDIGALLVQNRFNTEVYISDVELQPVAGGHKSSTVTFYCNSWVNFNPDHNERVFFSAKSAYLPSKTPKGLKGLREKELEAIRGDGTGERMEWERIYDYDVYNDLGNPDADPNTRRPVLGGKKRPYPRRCRTGRPRCVTDPSSETRAKGEIYVPRDEEFTERKEGAFVTKTVLSGLSAVTTGLKVAGDKQKSFPSLAAIDALYEDGYKNQPGKQVDVLNLVDRLETQVQLLLSGKLDLKAGLGKLLQIQTPEVKDKLGRLFKFQTPEIHDKDKLAWFRDEEFARQTLAGMNPLSIELVTELPIFSKLDQETYGPGDSLITKALITDQLNGVMTADEAFSKKKLFMLDYHDKFLPYVHAVREQDDTTLYASRTLFFLTDEGTLKPIAIELTRPKSQNLPQWREVYMPGSSVRDSWLWQLAKTHVLAHDTGYHQLVSHWLRTHCCVEPYVIAAHRQLSQMHPIYRLLHPHFRFTMEINAQARDKLISAGGIIESTFSPGKHCMELSSGVYDKFWRFDKEALPEDLIRRGMAFKRDDGELELTIKDYPYANDGLLIWKSVEEWVSDYVNYYYKRPSDIAGDKELHEFWEEVRNKGHGDKKDETWWPELDGYESLIQILTTIIWVASAHHAAVNFGQYPYAGYFPNRPTIARRNMPTEHQGPEVCLELSLFEKDPVKVLLDTFPSQYQSTLFLPVLNVLSSHSPGEEYMGTHREPDWMADPEVRAAFGRFNWRMMEIAEEIDSRNKDPKLKNRQGPGVLPYVLLKPNYGDTKDMKSVMEMGIPNSISI